MGKKRKASGGLAQSKGPRDYDSADAKIGLVNSFEDIADDQENYFLGQDQILFDDNRKSKKQRRLEEEEGFLEASDEEVLDHDDESEDQDDDEEEEDGFSRKGKQAGRKQTDDHGSDAEHQEEGGGDASWWGSSRKEYYNNDEIENEDDALEEEREALRLQKKKLARLAEEDFMFDEDEWRGPETEGAEQEEVVTEVLKDAEISPDMSPEERYRLLQSIYPELDYLSDELLQLQPLLVTLQKQSEGQDRKTLAVIKYRILGSYVATLAMYFATLSSPARESNGETRALNPTELRDHEVMGTLLECRDAWKKVEHLETTKNLRAAESIPSPPKEELPTIQDTEGVPKAKKSSKDPASKKAKAKAKRQAKVIEDSLADLDALITTKKKPKKKLDTEASAQDGNSDFGEEEILDARAAADKAARKKSLRFYTSQIVQKASRRADAGRDAGGDMDIPYRERLRDRQARLMAEAEKRGKKDSKHGAALGDASDEEDQQAANAIRDDEDEYYDIVSARKKGEKAAKAAALAAIKKEERVVEVEEIGEDGKRRITYAIQKNKGLGPNKNHKKDKNNPRVKKRKRYDERTKKLKSMRPVYQGGEGKGYQGELTGIKSGLIKSVRL